MAGVADVMLSIADVAARFHELKAAGTFEENLLMAYTSHRGGAAGAGMLHWLFRAADRERLRTVARAHAGGDPVPGQWPRVMYRGRLGDGPVCGISWTTSLAVARFFALRPAPADAIREVWTATVGEADVYCYRPDIAVEFLVDVNSPRLLESGAAAIVAGFRRDGVDEELLALGRHWHALKVQDPRRAAPHMDSDSGTRALAVRLGMLRDADDTTDVHVLQHLAALLAPVTKVGT